MCIFFRYFFFILNKIRVLVPSAPPPPPVCLSTQNVHPPYLSLTISFPNAADGSLPLLADGGGGSQIYIYKASSDCLFRDVLL